MQNVATKVEGNTLWIGVDLDQQFGPTKGGKGTVVAATGGFRPVPGAAKHQFQLYLYKRNEQQK